MTASCGRYPCVSDEKKKKKIYSADPLSSSTEVPANRTLASSTKLLPEGYFGQSFVRFKKVPGSWSKRFPIFVLRLLVPREMSRSSPSVSLSKLNVGPSEIARKPFSAVLFLLFPYMLPFLSLSVQ